MNIAIVDDMPRELTRISGIIEKYSEENHIPIEVSTFQSAEELLEDYRPLQYTLILMDIYMDEMTGVEAAQKLRETDNEALIAFITTSPDHTFDAFKVHAYEYILKVPEDEELSNEIFRVLDDVVAFRNLSEDGILVSVDGAEKTFSFASIVYAQNEKNYIRITDRQGRIYRTRMTFSEMNSLLSKDTRFLQINRGIIINMDFIDKFGRDVCELKGGYSLPVNVREQKRLDQIRRNYIFAKLHNRQRMGGEAK